MAIDLDLERLLAPIEAGAPSGRNLRYDPAFEALRTAADATPVERTLEDGRKVMAPPQRDFGKIRRDALALLRVGRDLRVQTLLAEALAASEGPAGIAAGLALIRRSLAEHWDSVHPSLDASETQPADQAALRLNALRSLAAPDDMLLELGRMRLLEVPGLGALSYRGWELATGRSTPAPYETKPEPGSLEVVLKAAAPELVAERVAALDAAAGEVRAIDALLAARIEDAGALPNLGPLAALIERMRGLLDAHAPTPAPSGETVPGDGPPDPGGPPPAAPVATAAVLPGRFERREEVVRALDLAIDYYRRHEPGSPVPLLLERAKRMARMDFLSMMGELAPDALERLKDLLGPVEPES